MEKYLQFYNNKNFEIESRINKAKKLNKNYDDRSKLEIVQDLRKEIGKAAPTYHPSNFLYKFNKEEIKKLIKNFSCHLQVNQIFRQFITTKMENIVFIKVIDMALIIQTIYGMKRLI